MAAGVIGELAFDGPMRAQPGIINSDGVTNPNRIGRVFTLVAGVGNDGQMIIGGTGKFAGILANPKVYALRGTTALSSVGPSLDLAQYSKGEFVYDTTGIWVPLAAAANVGDLCDFNTTTGVITSRPLAASVTGAVTSNVATITVADANGALIYPGTILNTSSGPATVISYGSYSTTTGLGTLNLSVVPNAASGAITFNSQTPTGSARMSGFEVVRYTTDAASLAVIGNIN